MNVISSLLPWVNSSQSWMTLTRNWNSKPRDGWGGRIKRMRTILNVKSSSAKKIEAMKLKHSKDMATEISRLKYEQYRKDRIHIRRLLLWRSNWRPWINLTS